MLAIVGSVGVALAGLYLLLSPAAAGMAVFGWIFVVLGVLGAVANVALRARTRRDLGTGRR